MIVLDTNVFSAVMETRVCERVVRWFDAQPRESMWTTAITVMEARFGIERLGEGPRRQALHDAFEYALAGVLEGRVLLFDTAAAREAATLSAERSRAGRIVDFRDTQIAGIVRAHNATLATRNTRDFVDAGIPLADPWKADA
jgi:predicted nucleic acid-binding protein